MITISLIRSQRIVDALSVSAIATNVEHTFGAFSDVRGFNAREQIAVADYAARIAEACDCSDPTKLAADGILLWKERSAHYAQVLADVRFDRAQRSRGTDERSRRR